MVGGMWIKGVWIGSVWIGLRNSLTVGRIGIEKWKGNSPWIKSGLRNGKETHCGSAFGARQTVGGAVRSACGVCCEECAAVRSACESLCCCEECAVVRELRPCCVRNGNGLK